MLYLFADCALDVATHQLRRNGQVIHVEPQVFDVIACIVRAEGALVDYDSLIAKVWQGRIVSDATVAARLSFARNALGDDGKRQSVLRTVPRRGVKLVVPVEKRPLSTDPANTTAPTDPLEQTIRYTRSSDGTGIAWAECGEGPPLLRAGHWMGHLEHDWTSPVWQPLIARLSASSRLVRYDPRGTGLSDRVLNGATVTELADDLEAVADAAGLERFPIFATSQSVPVALTFAARAPERVSRMVLLNGLVRGASARGERDRTEAMLAMIRSGWGIPDSAFMQAIATVFMPDATREELRSLVALQALSATADIAASIRRIIGEIDIRDVLGRVECTCLVVHASGDQVQSPEESRKLARSLANSEFQTLNSRNHILAPSDQVWEAFFARMERFLAEDI